MSKRVYPSQDRLRELFDVDADGDLVWRRRSDVPDPVNTRFAGKKAGCICASTGYRLIGIDYVVFVGHRLAWIREKGPIPAGMELDHRQPGKEHRSSCRISDLRLATRQENSRNHSLRSDNKSGLTGVSWTNRDNVWVAMVNIDGRMKRLGTFTDKVQACYARDTFVAENYGEFGRPNFRWWGEPPHDASIIPIEAFTGA